MNPQQRAIEATNLERRLARVEELLADKDELNSTGGAPGANVIQHRKPPREGLEGLRASVGREGRTRTALSDGSPRSDRH